MIFGAIIKLNKRGYALIGSFLLIFIYFRFRNQTTIENEGQISLKDLLQTAIKAAEVGGELIVSAKDNLKIQSKGKTKEGLDDRFTSADILSHCAMKGIITDTFPKVQFISEETNTPCESQSYHYSGQAISETLPEVKVKASDVTIWIDPLDATYEYTEKLYEYVTTMVCVVIKGEPIIGVIHKPFFESTSWAIVGYGQSGSDLTKRKKEDTSDKIKVIISRSHSGTIKEVLKKNFKDVEVVIAAGAGYKALKVASGTVDAYLHITAIKKWDICAGNAILNALGGKMTNKYGKSLTYYNDSDVVNKDGLIATLANHDLFVDKL